MNEIESGDVFIETLRCALTEAEVAERADLASRAGAQVAQITEELASHTKQQKARLKHLERERGHALRCVHQRAEMREVECRSELDYDQNAVRVVRTDTGELVRERAMTPAERQQGLFTKGPKAVEAGAAD